MSDEINKAPPAVGEPDADELMRVVGELERLEAKATERPWSEFEDADEGSREVIDEQNATVAAIFNSRDMALIAAARNHLPTLLSAIRRLTAANAELVKERDAEKEHADRMVREVSAIARESMDRQMTLARLEAEVIASRDIVKAAESERDAAREEAKRLREALEPFVRAFMYVHRDPHADENNPGFRDFLDGNEVIPRQMSSEEVLSVGHFRHAVLAMESAALSAPAGSQQEGKA